MNSLFPTTKIYLLRNPVDLASMENCGGYRRSNTGVLFLGWFIPAKGVYDLVDAFSILLDEGYDVQLDFYGTKEKEKLRRYISAKSLEHAIKVHGWINGNESTMLVLPSYSEGVPNVILEAMATQTPIIATHVGGLKEILRDEENALIAKVNDPYDLSEKIKFFLENPEVRKLIVNKAFQDVVEKYDIQVVKNDFGRICEEIQGLIC